MNATNPTPLGRRAFFQAAARGTLLGVLGLIGATLGRRAALPGQTCDRRGLCRGCGVFDGCGLPAALSARSARTGRPPS